MKLTVTYPEAVKDVDGRLVGFRQVPAAGAVARLYNKDAICKGYLDAKLDLAYIGDKPIISKYEHRTNEEGEISFNNIKAGEYFLILYASQLYKYTEKYIEVPLGDTLRLKKDFTASLSFFKGLEPWDYEVPTE